MSSTVPLNVVFLYSELMPNFIGFLRELTKDGSYQAHVFYWDKQGTKTPFSPTASANITLYRRSEWSCYKIFSEITALNPVALYVVGWMDKGYLYSAFRLRPKIPVVLGLDDWWLGTMKQSVLSLFSSITIQRCFSHAWIPGPRQYEYARKLGFLDSNIEMNLLACDLERFNSCFSERNILATSHPTRFVYVGRFSHEKGIDVLVEAYNCYRHELGGDWELTCVGNGPLENIIRNSKAQVELKPFCNQEELTGILSKSGAFILASHRDYSPLAIQEAAAAGLPLITSTMVGNNHLFLIKGYNGFSFKAGSPRELANTMKKLSDLPPTTLMRLGANSHELAQRITPGHCAAAFKAMITRSANVSEQE